MGCAASVPEEDKKNKKGGKGKEAAAEEAPKAAEVAPATEAAKPAEENKPAEAEKPADAEKPKEEAKPAESAPAAEAAKPAEPAPSSSEPAKPAEPVPVAAAAAEEKPAEAEKPKEEPKVEDQPAAPAESKPEEPKVEEVKKEEPKEEAKPAEPAAEPVKTEEVKVEPKEDAPKDEAPKAEEPKVEASQDATPTRKPKIAVVYYSTYGHILQLAEQVAEGAKKTGAQVDIFQIRETLSDEILEKMHAPPKAAHPTIELATTLTEYDGFLFGIPTRYGIWPAQWKSFLDATGQIWQAGAIHGKFGGVFTSTASQHGGIETTAFNALTFFTHHGINFVPLGYAKAFPELTTLTEVMGGTPYGAGTIAGGDGSRQPSDLEKKICQVHGEYFAQVVTKQFA